MRFYSVFFFVSSIIPLLGLCSIIFDRLAKNGRMYEEATTRHLNEYGESGLRTLALAYKKLEESEYSAWNSEFMKAKTSIGPDRDAMLERVSDAMEKELILVGATAVEDKLQKGVPQCIDKLAQAGIFAKVHIERIIPSLRLGTPSRLFTESSLLV